MQPTKLLPIFFFQAFSGLVRVILTSVGCLVCKWMVYLGFCAQVKWSCFYSNSLSYRWQPPAVLASHLPEITWFLESSNFSISTGALLNTCKENLGKLSWHVVEGTIMKGP